MNNKLRSSGILFAFAFLWFLYKDRLVVSLKEPKVRISLAATHEVVA